MLESVKLVERVKSLREIEEEVTAEGREWTRRRLQEKLQAEADRVGSVFPPQPKEGQAAAYRMVTLTHGGGLD